MPVGYRVTFNLQELWLFFVGDARSTFINQMMGVQVQESGFSKSDSDSGRTSVGGTGQMQDILHLACINPRK